MESSIILWKERRNCVSSRSTLVNFRFLVGLVLISLQCFVCHCLSFCTFGYCIVCPSLIYHVGIFIPILYNISIKGITIIFQTKLLRSQQEKKENTTPQEVQSTCLIGHRVAYIMQCYYNYAFIHFSRVLLMRLKANVVFRMSSFPA